MRSYRGHRSLGAPGLVFRMTLAILILGIAVALLMRLAYWVSGEVMALAAAFKSLM